MVDWNKIISGRSTMGRARPLLLTMNAQKWREEEREDQRGPGEIPGGKRGADVRIRIRNDGERVSGRGNNFAFLGRSRCFLAPVNVQIRKQPLPNPTVWLWDLDPKVNLQPPPPISLKITLSHPAPIFSYPCLAHVITYAPAMDCHQPHPLLYWWVEDFIRVRRPPMTTGLCCKKCKYMISLHMLT